MTDNRNAAATQRIITVLQALADHPQRGVPVGELLQTVGKYGGNADGQRDQLGRDLRHLRNVGFRIDNVAGEGDDARYVLRPGDDRVRVSFDKDQLFQLQRAAVLVGVDRLVEIAATTSGGEPSGPPVIADISVPAVLNDIHRAVTSRAKIKFEYSGKSRTIHPYGLRMAPRGWALDGWEEESGQPRVFSLQRMSGVRIGRPGTASPPERSVRPTLDPLRFEVDDSAPAVMRAGIRFRESVDAVLHRPLRVEPGPVVDGEPTEDLHYEVTNHTNFLVRVLRLDERVVLLGGDTMRAALHRMLTALGEVQ